MFMIGDGNGVTRPATILAVNDAIAESDESFTVSVDSADPPSTIGTPSSQNATIMAAASDRK